MAAVVDLSESWDMHSRSICDDDWDGVVSEPSAEDEDSHGVLIISSDDEDEGEDTSQENAMELSYPGTDSLPTDIGSIQANYNTLDTHPPFRPAPTSDHEENDEGDETFTFQSLGTLNAPSSGSRIVALALLVVMSASILSTSYLLWERSSWIASTQRLENQMRELRQVLLKNVVLREGSFENEDELFGGTSETVSASSPVDSEALEQDILDEVITESRTSAKESENSHNRFRDHCYEDYYWSSNSFQCGNSNVDWEKTYGQFKRFAKDVKVKTKRQVKKLAREIREAHRTVRKDADEWLHSVNAQLQEAFRPLSSEDAKPRHAKRRYLTKTVLTSVALASVGAWLAAETISHGARYTKDTVEDYLKSMRDQS